MIDVKVWIFNSVLKSGMIKDIDKAGKPIKRQRKTKAKKKSNPYSLNIKKFSYKLVSITKKQQTVILTDEFLLTKSEKSVLLYSITNIWL